MQPPGGSVRESHTSVRPIFDTSNTQPTARIVFSRMKKGRAIRTIFQLLSAEWSGRFDDTVANNFEGFQWMYALNLNG